jgi:hypothetical protein
MPGSIEINQIRLSILFLRSGGVLFHLNLLYANDLLFLIFYSICGIKEDHAICREGMVILSDLVARRLVVVEVVLAIEVADGLNTTSEGDGCSYGGDQRSVLKNRLTARKSKIEVCHTRVRLIGGIS